MNAIQLNSMEKGLLISNLMITGFLTGLIWFVQVVHYPIFGNVKPENFPNFHHAHTFLTGKVVALPMLIELVLAIVLFATFSEKITSRNGLH